MKLKSMTYKFILNRDYSYFSLPSHTSSPVAIDCVDSTPSGKDVLIVQSNYFLNTNIQSVPNSIYNCSYLHDLYRSGNELLVYIIILYSIK